jgi:hypothetical protein
MRLPVLSFPYQWQSSNVSADVVFSSVLPFLDVVLSPGTAVA